MNNNINIPSVQNVQQLKQILEQYGGLLSPQNYSLVGEVIANLEQGAAPTDLQNLAVKVEAQAQNQQQNNTAGSEIKNAASSYRRFVP